MQRVRSAKKVDSSLCRVSLSDAERGVAAGRSRRRKAVSAISVSSPAGVEKEASSRHRRGFQPLLVRAHSMQARSLQRDAGGNSCAPAGDLQAGFAPPSGGAREPFRPRFEDGSRMDSVVKEQHPLRPAREDAARHREGVKRQALGAFSDPQDAAEAFKLLSGLIEAASGLPKTSSRRVPPISDDVPRLSGDPKTGEWPIPSPSRSIPRRERLVKGLSLDVPSPSRCVPSFPLPVPCLP